MLSIVLCGSEACSDDGINWKKEIKGSVFKDFETVLYVGEVPEAVEKDNNSIYLYYPDYSNKEKLGKDNDMGYFRYSIPFVALYTDGHQYKLVDKDGIITRFLKDKQISENGIQVKLSGIIGQENGFTFDTHYYFFEITNIK